jgi:hypothetical protein
VRSLRRPLAALALALAAGSAGAAEPAVTPEQVQAAVKAVRADPLLGGTRTERKLRWKPDQDDAPKPKPTDSGWNWLAELAQWLAASGRVLMWLLGAAAVAVLVVMLRRWILVRAEFAMGPAPPRPSHVRDLDIRPDSLPDDIAAAARALWHRGEQRACLSLLYRGALSRLVHVHAVPIRGASTEGECVRLAARTLPAAGAGFFERLVQSWLLVVYGARDPDGATVLALCDEFEARLPAQAAARAA